MQLTTTYRDLQPFGLADGEIRLTGVELFDDPGAFIALVAFTDNGVSGIEPLRLDFGKMCFLDIQPFELAYGETEGRRRANTLAHRLVEILADTPSTKAAYGD